MAVGQDKIGLSEKDETIGRLYALRAGLSVVAREKETADGIMHRAERNKQTAISSAKNEVELIEHAISGQNNDIENSKVLIEEREKAANSANLNVRVVIVILKVLAAVVFGAIALFPSALMILIDCCYGGAFGADWVSNDFLRVMCHWASDGVTFSFGTWIVAIVFTIIALAVTGGLIFLSVIILSGGLKYSYKEKKAAISKQADLKTIISEAQDKLKELEVARQQAQIECLDKIQDAENTYLIEKKEATEHAVAGLVMINALEDSFGDLIDTRDWKNTDILIYALETRRAENMKEALQVVDGERRTERIVEAVNTAGQEICKSINTGLRRLQGEMTRCFDVLGQLVVSQGDRIAGHIQSLGDGIAANNRYMAQLTSQLSMTNALMAKANENSAAIAAEVNRLRTGAEYAQARYLYGTK